MPGSDTGKVWPDGVIAALDDWIDGNTSQVYQNTELALDWARVSKIGEEFGEVIDALIGVTGQNPRKGYYSSQRELLDELCDVAVTAILAIQHWTKNEEETYAILQDRWKYRRTVTGM